MTRRLTEFWQLPRGWVERRLMRLNLRRDIVVSVRKHVALPIGSLLLILGGIACTVPNPQACHDGVCVDETLFAILMVLSLANRLRALLSPALRISSPRVVELKPSRAMPTGTTMTSRTAAMVARKRTADATRASRTRAAATQACSNDVVSTGT